MWKDDLIFGFFCEFLRETGSQAMQCDILKVFVFIFCAETVITGLCKFPQRPTAKGKLSQDIDFFRLQIGHMLGQHKLFARVFCGNLLRSRTGDFLSIASPLHSFLPCLFWYVIASQQVERSALDW